MRALFNIKIIQAFELGLRFTTNIFKVIDWVVFVMLSVLALISVEESIIAAYSNEKTSWLIENHPIQSHPTLSMCFALSHSVQSYWAWTYYLTLGIDFNITMTTSSKGYVLLFI